MSSSASHPSGLKVDEEGKLRIYENQAALDDFLSGSGQDAIDARQNVRTLVIEDVPRIPENWPTLPRLQNLAIQVRRQSLIINRGALCASALPALQELVLCNDSYLMPITPECPVLEGVFKKLERIRVIKNRMGKDAIDALQSQLSTLTHLELYWIYMGAEERAHLAQVLQDLACLKLTHLSVKWEDFGAEGCAHLARALEKGGCPNLTHLDLSDNKIDARGGKHLARALEKGGCPNLTHLDLSDNKIDAEGCKHLAQALQKGACPNLTFLNLGDSQIGEGGCAHLARALEKGGCPNLTHLNLDYNKIDAEGCKHLAEGLQKHKYTNLTDLYLRGNKIGAEGCEHLARILQQDALPKLTHIYLDHNDLGTKGCEHLVKALEKDACINLTLLNLGSNEIGAMGCKHLARALEGEACPNLTYLSLSSNEIGAEGCQHLARALEGKACSNLTHLDLSDNEIGAEECKHLARALGKGCCPKLTLLELVSNKIGNEGCKTLVNSLKERTHFKELYLGYNDIDALPDALGELRYLELLSISRNDIKTIQPALYDLILRLRSFDAHDNPLVSPAYEVYQQGLPALKRDLERRKESEETLRIARIMVLGDSMAGKTTLCRSLPLKKPCPPVGKNERTHALEICEDWKIKNEEGEEQLTIRLWDFAGHQVYYATHRTFFSRLCIYVIVAKIEVEREKMQGVIDSSIEWLMSICKAVPAGAQVVVVGTYPHDEKKEEGVLEAHRIWLEDELRKADEERVNSWNEYLEKANKERDNSWNENLEEDDDNIIKADRANIHGVFWVDCLVDKENGDHNLGEIADKLGALAKETVKKNQTLSTQSVKILEAHDSLCKSTSAGVSSLKAIRARAKKNAKVNEIDDDTMRDTLQFANDVGILQYYPDINQDLVFIDPVFLVQAFGILINDMTVFKQYIAEDRDKKLSYFMNPDRLPRVVEDFYKSGILPKAELRNVWLFKEKAKEIAQTLSCDGAKYLAETLIEILKRHDLVFEHKGLLGDKYSGSVDEYYLVPEVWSHPSDDTQDGRRATVDMRASPDRYKPDTHMMIGWEVEVKGWLLPSFYRKFVCKCATVLAEMEPSLWRDGTVTLGRNAVEWVSASWPNKERPLVLWLEGIQQKVTIKIAGLKWKLYLMRNLNAGVIKALQKLAKEERIGFSVKNVGTLFPRDEAVVEMVWKNMEEVKTALDKGSRVIKETHNGENVEIPLFLFNIDADPSEIIPNFDDELPVAREDHDPEFVLHCRGYSPDMERPPADWDQAMSFIRKVMNWRLGTFFFKGSFSRKKRLVESEEVKRRIQVLDLVGYGMGRNLKDARCHLYMTHPLRNLYLPFKGPRVTLLNHFCAEAMRMFGALGGKKAEFKIGFLAEREVKNDGGAGAKGVKAIGSEENKSIEDIGVNDELTWPLPKAGPGPRDRADSQPWYFLAESSHAPRDEYYGINLSNAISSIKNLKNVRIDCGVTERKKSIEVFYSESSGWGVSLEALKLAEMKFKRAVKEKRKLCMQYDVKFYNWNEEIQAWK